MLCPYEKQRREIRTDMIVCATKRAGHDISCPYEDKVVRGFTEWAASSQENVRGVAWFGCAHHKCYAPTGNGGICTDRIVCATKSSSLVGENRLARDANPDRIRA